MAVVTGTINNDTINVGTASAGVIPATGATGAADQIQGLAGNDTINAGGGGDTIFAGLGDDTVNGEDGTDVLYGDRDDAGTVLTPGGNDTMSGGAGTDSLFGDGGDDTLYGFTSAGGGGMADTDTFSGGTGFDLMYGNDGTDTFNLDSDGTWGNLCGFSTVTGSNGKPDGVLLLGKVLFQDVVDGTDANNTDNSDRVNGTSAAEVFVVNATTAGVDISGKTEENSPTDDDADSILDHFMRIEVISAGGGNDVILMQEMDQFDQSRNPQSGFGALVGGITGLDGGEGNDFIVGSIRSDIIIGGDGNDYIDGGQKGTTRSGVNYATLTATNNSDNLTGGAGNDIFAFNPDSGSDTVTDFTDGADKIRIKGFGTSFDSFAEIQPLITGGNTITFPGAGGTVITLSGFAGTLDATDFQFVA